MNGMNEKVCLAAPAPLDLGFAQRSAALGNTRQNTDAKYGFLEHSVDGSKCRKRFGCKTPGASGIAGATVHMQRTEM